MKFCVILLFLFSFFLPDVQKDTPKFLAPPSEITVPFDKPYAKLARKIFGAVVLKQIQGQKLSNKDRKIEPFCMQVTNFKGTVLLGSYKCRTEEGTKQKQIFIKSQAQLKNGMVIEIVPHFDAEGILILELYQIKRKEGEKIKEKLSLTPRFDPRYSGCFDNQWGNQKRKQTSEKEGQAQIRDIVNAHLMGKSFPDQKRELPSYRTKVRNRACKISFGHFMKGTKEKGTQIFVISKSEFKYGMEVEIVPKFDPEGILYLELYEKEKLLFVTRFNRERRGYFCNSCGNKKEASEEEGRLKIRETVLSYLRGETILENKRDLPSYRTKVNNNDGTISFGCIPKKRGAKSRIYVKSRAELKFGKEIEIVPQFDSQGVLYLELYEVKEGVEAKTKLSTTARFDAVRAGYFNCSWGKSLLFEGAVEKEGQTKIRETVLAYLRGETIPQTKRDLPSYRTKVGNGEGTLSFGTVNGGKIYIRSKGELEAGMEVEIVPKFDAKGVLYLELYEVKEGGEAKTKLRMTAQFDARRAGYFNSSWGRWPGLFESAVEMAL